MHDFFQTLIPAQRDIRFLLRKKIQPENKVELDDSITLAGGAGFMAARREVTVTSTYPTRGIEQGL
jgi:hypothetical protein